MSSTNKLSLSQRLVVKDVRAYVTDVRVRENVLSAVYSRVVQSPYKPMGWHLINRHLLVSPV